MQYWQKQLRYDPIRPLLRSDDEAIRYFVRRDLLEAASQPIETLWQCPRAMKILSKQLESGAWKYSGGARHVRSAENYNQIETFRALGCLIEKYGLDCRHPAIARAANYLFLHQTEDGDFRGIYGTQYAPNYSAAIMELLIKAGYNEDPHIEKGFHWLLSLRQQDGGWAIPLRTMGKKFDDQTLHAEPISPNITKPFSHLVTGIVLRTFAAHPHYRTSDEAQTAGKLLASRFFAADTYPDRCLSSFWTTFSYPFWFTDLLSSLDSLSWMGFGPDEGHVSAGLDWLVSHQGEHGLWVLTLLRMTTEQARDDWISLAISRMLKRFYR